MDKIRYINWGSKDDSAARSTHRYCRWPRFDSLHTYQMVHKCLQIQFQGYPSPLTSVGIGMNEHIPTQTYVNNYKLKIHLQKRKAWKHTNINDDKVQCKVPYRVVVFLNITIVHWKKYHHSNWVNSERLHVSTNAEFVNTVLNSLAFRGLSVTTRILVLCFFR